MSVPLTGLAGIQASSQARDLEAVDEAYHKLDLTGFALAFPR